MKRKHLAQMTDLERYDHYLTAPSSSMQPGSWVRISKEKQEARRREAMEEEGVEEGEVGDE